MSAGGTSDVDPQAFADPSIPHQTVVDRYLEYASRLTLSPLHFHAGCILPGLCHLLHHAGVQVALPVTGHRPEHPVFWTGLLGDSGSGKTQAVSTQREIIDTVHGHYLRQHDDEPAEACLPMTGSPEGLLYKTQRWFNPEIGGTPMIYFEDELSTLIGRRGSWSEFFSTMNRLYDGQDYTPEYRKDQRADERKQSGKARKDDDDDKRTQLVHPLPSALFATTVSGLTDAGRNFLHGGFASRVFWLHVEVTPASIRFEQQIDPELGRLRGELLSAYDELYVYWRTQRRLEGPQVVGVSPEAQDELIRHLDPYRRLVGQDYVVSSHLPRLIGQAQRICCVIAAARRKQVAGLAEAAYAAHLCKLSFEARMRLEDSWEDLSPKASANPQVFLRKVAKCEEAIRKRGPQGITRTALLKRFRKADLDLWLEQLMEGGRVFSYEAMESSRKSIRYFHETFRSQGWGPGVDEEPKKKSTVISIPVSGGSHE